MSVREIVICPETGILVATALVVSFLGLIITKMSVIPSQWGLIITILGGIVLSVGLFDLSRKPASEIDGTGSG